MAEDRSLVSVHRPSTIEKNYFMQWNELTEENQIDLIREKSKERTQVIFKHSTRCGISSVAKGRLEKWRPSEEFDFYFLDLIKHRPLSNKIAEAFQVYHQSPQVLVIRNGECVYDESHLGISLQEILDYAA